MNLNKLLQEYPDLKKYTDYLPDYIIESSIIKEYKSNSILFIKGNSADYIYWLCSGSIKVDNNFENGSYYFVSTINSTTLFHGFPDFVGAPALFSTSKTYATNVSTKSDCVIIQIPSAEFLTWYNTDARVARSVAEASSTHLYASTLRSENIMSHSILYLLVQYLIIFSEKNQNKSNSYTIPNTRDSLAEHFYATTRTVNRNIKKLKEDNYITIVNGKITFDNSQLLNLKKLFTTIK